MPGDRRQWKKLSYKLVLCQHTPIENLKKEILLKDLKYDEALTYAKSLERAAGNTRRWKTE